MDVADDSSRVVVGVDHTRFVAPLKQRTLALIFVIELLDVAADRGFHPGLQASIPMRQDDQMKMLRHQAEGNERRPLVELSIWAAPRIHVGLWCQIPLEAIEELQIVG